MIDPDFDPYDMLEDLAKHLKWHSEIVENVTKTQVVSNQNILELFKQLHLVNIELKRMGDQLDAIEQAAANNRT